MVRPMENTTEMQAMVNGGGDHCDGDNANNESQVKGQLISKDIFTCVNSSKNERKNLHKIDLERLVLCPFTVPPPKKIVMVLIFWASPKNWFLISASSKTFVLAQKLNLLNENHLLVWHKMFATIQYKFMAGLNFLFLTINWLIYFTGPKICTS